MNNFHSICCSSCRKKLVNKSYREKDGIIFCNQCFEQERTGILKLRFQILSRDNFTCQYCGRKAPEALLEIEHSIPAKMVGRSDWEKDGVELRLRGNLVKYKENLIVACFECNHGKGDILLKKYHETKEKS